MLKAFRDESVVDLAVRYRHVFPTSAISTERLVMYLALGGSIDWNTGALFDPRFGRPELTLEDTEDEETLETEEKPASVDIGNLIEDCVSFQMRDEETDFVWEHVEGRDKGIVAGSIMEIGPKFSTNLPGELRGCHIHTNQDTEMELLEPMTREEIAFYIGAVLWGDDDYGPSWWKMTTQKLSSWTEILDNQGVESEDERAWVMLITAVEFAQDEFLLAKAIRGLAEIETAIEATVRPDNMLHLLRKRKLDEIEMHRRAAATARRKQLFRPEWSYTSRWFFGIRDGVTIGKEQQNDIDYTKMEQLHQPGERVDGKLLEHEEERLSEYRWRIYFDQMYSFYKFDRATQETLNVRAQDGGPVNRSWTERNVYLARRSAARGENFARMLWKMLTWPVPLLEQQMEQLRKQYNAKTRECSNGPQSCPVHKLTPSQLLELENFGWDSPTNKPGQKWFKVPLRGQAAANWLKKNRAGTLGHLQGQPIHPQFRFSKGETWHKTELSKEHLKVLEQGLKWRQSRPWMESLPVEYIAEKYNAAKEEETPAYTGPRSGLHESRSSFKAEKLFKLRGSWTLDEALRTAAEMN